MGELQRSGLTAKHIIDGAVTSRCVGGKVRWLDGVEGFFVALYGADVDPHAILTHSGGQ